MEIEDWPNCPVPDCENKANIPGGAVTPASEFCVPHQRERSVAIQRLMDEVRNDIGTNVGCFDRAHNRHNR